MNALTPSLILFLATSSALLAEPGPEASPKVADATAEALPILQTKYVFFKELDYKPGDHLSDLVERSHGGIKFLPQEEKVAGPILVTMLPGNIGYWNLGSFKPEKSWSDFGMQLEQWSKQDVQGLVVDLRGVAGPDNSAEFDGAGQAGAFFAHDGKSPFSMVGASSAAGSFQPAHPFRGPVVVLIDYETGSAAGALAAYLKKQGALIMGEPCSCNCCVYEQKALSNSQVLSYEVSATTLSDGTQLSNHPITPDISPKTDAQTEKSALLLIRDGHVLDLILESAERHRMSEAALVKGEDPEWDAYLATLKKKKDEAKASVPPVHDIVLTAALDGIKAISIAGKVVKPPSVTAAAPAASDSVQ